MLSAMKRLAPPAALLALLLVLAACGQGQPETPTVGNSPPGGTGSNSASANQPTVEIGEKGLSETSLTVPESQTVVFVNNASDEERRLCIGEDGNCDMNNMPGAPPELLSGGFLLRQGTNRLVLFNQPGTYHLTVARNGKFNTTVTVHG